MPELWLGVFLAVVTVGLIGTVECVVCPGTYVEYVAYGRCFKLVTTPATRAAAFASCHGDQDGWLATLDIPALASGVITQYSIVADTYIGLHKLSSCSNPCTGLLAWDSRTGYTPSTVGYFANMKR